MNGMALARQPNPLANPFRPGNGVPPPYQGRLDLAPADGDADALYDMSARFYSPQLAAFTQLDAFAGSVTDPRSLNRFLYAAANPTTLIDPTGHAFISGTNPDTSEKAIVVTTTTSSGSKTTVIRTIASSEPTRREPTEVDSTPVSVGVDAAAEALRVSAAELEHKAQVALQNATRYADQLRDWWRLGRPLSNAITWAGDVVAATNRAVGQAATAASRVLGPIGLGLAAFSGAEEQARQDAERTYLDDGDRVRRQLMRAGTAVAAGTGGGIVGGFCPPPFSIACIPIGAFIGERIGSGPLGDVVIGIDDAASRWNPFPWLMIDFEPPSNWSYG